MQTVYRITRRKQEWEVSSPGRFRGYFDTKRLAIEMAMGLARLDKADGGESVVVLSPARRQRWLISTRLAPPAGEANA